MITAERISVPLAPTNAGFTAVELMITLFIAAVFVMTGFQLYTVIMVDGASATSQAKANNIAYEFLANYSANAAASCTPTSATPTPPSNTGLANVVVTVNTTCPYGNGSSLSRIEVIVSYGGISSPAQQVSSVVYAI